MTTRLVEKMIKVYTDYVLAYSKYIDKYMVNKSEEEAEAESEVCYHLWQMLTLIVDTYSVDEEMAYDIMDILSRTDYKDKKIDMANNLKNLFDYIGG